MDIVENKDVKMLFKTYPSPVCERLSMLRELVFETAVEIGGNEILEETFKWGEASYITKHGSTIRMNWIRKNPDNYAMYFHCKTKLIDTFKELYSDKLKFDANRAIIFNLKDDIAIRELKHCIRLSLTYHKVKNMPLLGA